MYPEINYSVIFILTCVFTNVIPCLSQSSSMFSNSSRIPMHCSQSSASKGRLYRYKIHEQIEEISTRSTAIYDDKMNRSILLIGSSKKAFSGPYLWEGN